MARLPRLFRTSSWVPYIKIPAADIIVFGIISSDFLFYIDNDMLWYSLESPHRGDSNENTQHIFMIEKRKKMPYYASNPGIMINTD